MPSPSASTCAAGARLKAPVSLTPAHLEFASMSSAVFEACPALRMDPLRSHLSTCDVRVSTTVRIPGIIRSQQNQGFKHGVITFCIS